MSDEIVTLYIDQWSKRTFIGHNIESKNGVLLYKEITN